jgi:hypothetical protein
MSIIVISVHCTTRTKYNALLRSIQGEDSTFAAAILAAGHLRKLSANRLFLYLVRERYCKSIRLCAAKPARAVDDSLCMERSTVHHV